MIFCLYIGNTCRACTANHKWLIEEAIPFHARFAHGAPITIAAFPEEVAA